MKNKTIKVALVPSIPFSLMYGGGETQVIKTAAALKKLDVETEFLHWENRDQKYDILHVFGAKYWQRPIIELAKGKNIPVVLSTISYVPHTKLRYMRYLLKKIYTRLVPIETNYLNIKTCTNLADILLPNSVAEAEYLNKYLGVDKSKLRVCINAVDDRFSDANEDAFRKRYAISYDFALCVGKIEPRKNQLALVNALKNTKRRLILIGDAIHNNKHYYEQVLNVIKGSDNIQHIESLPHENGILASAYAAARCHILLGRNETPGLVNLEAGLTGTPLAVYDCPPVREYLKEYPVYIKSLNPDDITKGVEMAWLQKRNMAMANYIKMTYSWDVTARQTLEAYNLVSKTYNDTQMRS